jgi:hypothetical protein
LLSATKPVQVGEDLPNETGCKREKKDLEKTEGKNFTSMTVRIFWDNGRFRVWLG